MSKGYLIFAYNNSQIDYGLIALCNAMMIQTHSTVKDVSLVTDQGTLDWLVQSQGELVHHVFDQIICHSDAEWGVISKNASDRRFNDTLSTSHKLPWANGSRATAYELSPYTETILIDCDYLICDSMLDMCWGSDVPFRINHQAKTINGAELVLEDVYIDPYSIKMFWATCVYFRKCPESKVLFDLVEHIRENYALYQQVYGFRGPIYRNDFAFSIALHMLYGFSSFEVPSLPSPFIMTSFDRHELHAVPGKDELTFMCTNERHNWDFSVVRTKNMSVHVLNKFSIIRHASRLIDLYEGL